MIYDQLGREPRVSAAAAAMAYNPFMLHRPSDYSMSSILSQPQYLPGMLSAHHGMHALPKLQQTVARSPLTGEMLMPSALSRPMRTLEPPESEVQDDPKVELESMDLWEKFHGFGTEMVITKSGRYVQK